MEEALIEVPTMRRFAGIELISDRILDETTILTLRHLLEKHELGEQIFETVKAHLSHRGMAMRQGTIVVATLIAEPRRLSLELGTDLPVKGLLVRFHGQQRVDPLLQAPMKNGRVVCRASAWISTPSAPGCSAAL